MSQIFYICGILGLYLYMFARFAFQNNTSKTEFVEQREAEENKLAQKKVDVKKVAQKKEDVKIVDTNKMGVKKVERRNIEVIEDDCEKMEKDGEKISQKEKYV